MSTLLDCYIRANDPTQKVAKNLVFVRKRTRQKSRFRAKMRLQKSRFRVNLTMDRLKPCRLQRTVIDSEKKDIRRTTQLEKGRRKDRSSYRRRPASRQELYSGNFRQSGVQDTPPY